jgi:hypothetical protein
MALRVSTGLRNSQATNLASLFPNGAILEIRTGSQPAGGDTAPSGTVLVTITLPNPSFGAAASGQIAKAGVWQDASADATGTAGWFRLRQAGDLGTTNTTDERLDGSVTVTGGGGDLTLDNTSITIAQQVTLNVFTITQPAS